MNTMNESLTGVGSRLVKLRAKLNGRMGPDGKPLPGYEKNCEAIRAEIARLENTTNNPPRSGTDAIVTGASANGTETTSPDN